MPNQRKHLLIEDKESFSYTLDCNVDVPLRSDENGVVRVNVYRPKDEEKHPVLCTYGPYGKDIHYKDFRAKSYNEVNPEHHSENSAWETPDPKFWTGKGYVVVRADERGFGQSPGLADSMSRGTSEAFFDVIEWAAVQSWSTGKVGLLGISYYAGSQWRVAARNPKGLAAIIPWEGMSDYYRDRVRHGGILSNDFINLWWNRQVVSNQYGRPGRAAQNWGPDTLEGDLSEEELKSTRRDQTIDTAKYRFMDEEYYKSRDYAMEDIKAPLLSVANWGGILLHLRGNVEGFAHAGSSKKFLRFITGRHDLPFYYTEEVAIQLSFLNAFLKDQDDAGWKSGKMPQVDMVLRKGNVGYNNPKAECQYPRRYENEWPIARTQYTRYYLSPSGGLSTSPTMLQSQVSYEAPNGDPVQFSSKPFTEETEITGHVVAHLNISCSPLHEASPTDIDLFVTLRHLDPSGKEVFYTGTTGDPVPLTKGWLRLSLRKTDPGHTYHRDYLPRRNYYSTDVEPVKPGESYPVDIEIWPTNVVIETGGHLVFEIAAHDTQGSGQFTHTHPEDRNSKIFTGLNCIDWSDQQQNYVVVPIIPRKA